MKPPVDKSRIARPTNTREALAAVVAILKRLRENRERLEELRKDLEPS